jgi:DNA polymerase
MTLLWCDTETYCETPINHGLHRYAEDVEVTLFAWAVNDEDVQVWDLTADEPMPVRLHDLLNDPEVMTVWHNSQFDRTVIRHALGIDLPIERVHDTMVRALAHGLPGSLDKLCAVMGVSSDAAKDKAGKALIQLLCKPRPKNMKVRRANRFTHPVEWERFKDYAKSDIRAMRVLYSKLPLWNYTGRELDLWHLDQRINDRGIQVDTELAVGALAAVDAAQVVLARRTRELTQDEVERASKRDQMLRYILKAFDEKTSTTKYKALVRAVSKDGRLRGLLQFCGASRTGRWAGRTFQPQNLPRLILDAIAIWFGIRPAQVREHHVEEYLATGIAAIKGGCADLLFDDVMSMCVNVIRGCLIAPPGKKLVVSDLANIEGRFAAWLAGEHWKLKAFRDYDEGSGHDNYVLAYSKAFGVTTQSVLDDKKAGGSQRQIGKVMELMLQYEGGVGAFLTGAATYGFDVEEMAANALETLPWEARRSAEEMLKWRKKKRLTTYGLSDTAFIVCETFKALWRTSHPAIASYWKELEQAAIRACENPGVRIDARKISFIKSGAWLRMILPSGRSVCYPSAKVEDGKLTYWGVHQYTRKWSKFTTYGGKLFENACQAGARDVMAHNMPTIDKCGYLILLTIHDELLTETLDSDEFTPDRLSSLLATNPPWAQGLPLAAGGFESKRYKKD